MSTGYLQKKYVRESMIETRDYQANLAEQAISENCMVVLPTGLGKTAIALRVIAEYLARDQAALFLAPTRVLVNQHYEFLKSAMTIGDISLITGEDPPIKRKKRWENSIVCATPEITKNDLDRGLVSADQFGLVIFDEAHRTVGDYAYAEIARRLAGGTARIMGMTATLPSERDKTAQIMETLQIQSVAQRTESSPDVVPYIQETSTEKYEVVLPPAIVSVQKFLKMALDQRYDAMARCGINLKNQKSMSALLRVRQYVLAQNRRAALPLFAAIRITYALNILEAHGITSFLRFCERTQKKKGAGVKILFAEDSDFMRAIRLARDAQAKGIEHPKIQKLVDILKTLEGKVLIFSSYRDSVDVIHTKLEEMGIKSGILIGKAGETGLKQKKQIETVRRFRDGEFDVMITTRVGEEGLDISEVNTVIFYDNVPSSIRYIQRRGRTGRKDAGRLIVLVAKGTIDEAYFWIGKRKMRAAQTIANRITDTFEARPTGQTRLA